MNPLQKSEFTVKSTIIRGEKPTKGLEAVPAPNPNQMNRIIGYLSDNTKVIVAQRPGKGGMDFTKLLGGKVYSVAADGVSPVYEKDGEGKATKIQKKEDGMPLFSSSGFYVMSSKEYPTLEIIEAFTILRSKGAQVWILTEKALAETQKETLTSDMDLDLVLSSVKLALSDEKNLVTKFDTAINSKREKLLRRAKEDADALVEEGTGEAYAGAEYVELKTSKKDGNPFVLFCWKAEGGEVKMGAITRELEYKEEARTLVKFLTVDEAIEQFMTTKGYKDLLAAVEAGAPVQFAFAQGHVMRTSVSFRRKVENILNEPEKPAFGDAVYIKAALTGWTKGLLGVMFSQHPTFPQQDYDAHHYVTSCRQAEIGMNKVDGKWSSPKGIHYSPSAAMLA